MISEPTDLNNAITCFQKEFLGEIQNISAPKQQALASQYVNNLSQKVHFLLTSLELLNFSSKNMESQVYSSLEQMAYSCDYLVTSFKPNGQTKQELEDIQQVKELEGAKVAFMALDQISTIKEIKNLVKQSAIKEIKMMSAHVLALCIKALAYLPEKALEGIGLGAKKMCESHDSLQASCRKVTQLMGQSLEFLNENTPEIIKEKFDDGVNYLKEYATEEINNNLAMGLSKEKSEKYLADLAIVATGLPILTLPVLKSLKKIMATALPTKNLIPSILSSSRTLKTVNPALSVSANSDHLKNRIIKSRTKIIPEDIGMNPLEFKPANLPFQPSVYALDGSMSIKEEGRVLKITLENIRAPKGTLHSWSTVMSNFKEIGKVNGVKELRLEAEIVNDKLLKMMERRYGPATHTIKQRFGESVSYQVYKILID